MRNQRLRNAEETDLDGRVPRSHGFTLSDGARPDAPVVLSILEPKVLEFRTCLDDRVLLGQTTPEHARDTAKRVDIAADSRATRAIGTYLRMPAGPDAPGEQAWAHADFYTQLPAYRRSLLRMGFTDGGAAEVSIFHRETAPTMDRVRAWFPFGIDSFILCPIGDGPVQRGIDLGGEGLHRRLAGHRA